MKRLIVVLVLIFLTGSLSTQAKGVPDYFVVTGENMTPMVLRLPTALIFDPYSRIEPAPQIESEPYILRSFVWLDTDELYEIELSPLHYYPEEGVIYFVGATERGIYQPYDNKWYAINPDYAATIDASISTGQTVNRLQHVLPQLWNAVSP